MVLVTSPGPLEVDETPNEGETALVTVVPELEVIEVPVGNASVDEELVDEAPLDEAPVDNDSADEEPKDEVLDGTEPELLPTAPVLGDEAPVVEAMSLDVEPELDTLEVHVVLLQLCVCGLVTSVTVLLSEDEVRATELTLRMLEVQVVLLQLCGWGVVAEETVLLFVGESTLEVGEIEVEEIEVEEIKVDDLVPDETRVCEYPEASTLDDGEEVGFEDPGPVCE